MVENLNEDRITLNRNDGRNTLIDGDEMKEINE